MIAIRTDTLPHAVSDMRRILREVPSAYLYVTTDTGWRVGSGRVTAEDGTQYVGHIVAARGRDMRTRDVRAYGPRRGTS